MNKEFGRILSFLRKGKGLSQKQVANDLGISQALLSHYEKGIRECGLDFLVKTADYFDVSTDYLLGRTVNPNGINASLSEADFEDVKDNITSTYHLISKKVNSDTNALIYSILSKINSKKISKQISEYLNSAQYIAFRSLYSLYGQNRQELFNISDNYAKIFTTTSMNINLAKIEKLSVDQSDKAKAELTSKNIAQEYPDYYSSLYNLIRNTEKSLKSQFKI